MAKVKADVGRLLLLSCFIASATACTASPTQQAASTQAGGQSTQVPETVMSETLRGNCAIQSASITLVDNAILTRAALTAESAVRMGKTNAFNEGDMRIAKLTALLDGTNPVLTDVPSIDTRIVIRLGCADGKERLLLGSQSGDQGLHIKIDDKIYRVPAAFRSDLEALVR